MHQFVVARRFNGPPESGNGGFVCGVTAILTRVPDAEVTLRRPPPLDVPLRVEGGEVYDGEHLVATATTAPDHDVTPPPFPGLEAATEAAARYAGLREHPFPTCYVCGPARADGLGLAPGPLADDDAVATPWTTPTDVVDPTLGGIQPQYVWAALDCPGAWALVQGSDTPLVLGRLAVRIHGAVRAGEPHVVVGWEQRPKEGRKHYAGTALYDATGRVLATGRATWIALQS